MLKVVFDDFNYFQEFKACMVAVSNLNPVDLP